jgi:hypothetical protein
MRLLNIDWWRVSAMAVKHDWRHKEEGRYKTYFEIMVNIGPSVAVWPLVQTYDFIGTGKWKVIG